MNNKLFIYLSPILCFFTFEYFISKPALFELLKGINVNPVFFFLIVLILLIVYSIKKILDGNIKNSEFYSNLIFPVIFQISTFLYILVEINALVIQFLVLLNFFVQIIYYRFISTISIGTKTEYFNTNIASVGNFLMIFLMSAFVYRLHFFINISQWLVMLFYVIILFLLIYQALWFNDINIKSNIFFVLLSTFVLIEIAWSLSFWPINFNALGLILALTYYMLIGILKHFLNNNLDNKIIKLYLGYGFTGIMLIIFTSKWL